MTLSTQFATMLSMIGMGVFFGTALDTYNRFLQRGKRKSWLIFMNDILFWILQGLLIFFVLFKVNQGELRFYIFIALLCGFAAYQSLFKQIYLKWLEKIICFIISVYRFVVKLVQLLIIRPVYAFVTTFIAILVAIGKGLFAFTKWLIHFIWTTTTICVKPITWFFLLIWKLFPKGLKKTVEKFYNIIAGKCRGLKNYINIWISKWNKKDN